MATQTGGRRLRLFTTLDPLRWRLGHYRERVDLWRKWLANPRSWHFGTAMAAATRNGTRCTYPAFEFLCQRLVHQPVGEDHANTRASNKASGAKTETKEGSVPVALQ